MLANFSWHWITSYVLMWLILRRCLYLLTPNWLSGLTYTVSQTQLQPAPTSDVVYAMLEVSVDPDDREVIFCTEKRPINCEMSKILLFELRNAPHFSRSFVQDRTGRPYSAPSDPLADWEWGTGRVLGEGQQARKLMLILPSHGGWKAEST